MARDFGTVSELYPPGITDLRDLPHRWFEALRLALMFIGFDELEEGEKPPKTIWLDEEQLSDWFTEVKRRRKEKYGGDSDGGGAIEDPVQNDAARALIAG